jgi:hypothetical protein
MKYNTVCVTPITKAQIKIIYTLAHSLNMVDKMADVDILHEMISSMTGKDHVTNLTSKEAFDVIGRLQGNKKDKFQKKQKTVPGMASPAQLALIRRLMREIVAIDSPEATEEEFEKRLKGWIKRNTMIEDIRWLKPRQASIIIEGMKKYKLRKEVEKAT